MLTNTYEYLAIILRSLRLVANRIRKPTRHIFATIWRICREYIFLHSQGYSPQCETSIKLSKPALIVRISHADVISYIIFNIALQRVYNGFTTNMVMASQTYHVSFAIDVVQRCIEKHGDIRGVMLCNQT